MDDLFNVRYWKAVAFLTANQKRLDETGSCYPLDLRIEQPVITPNNILAYKLEYINQMNSN